MIYIFFQTIIFWLASFHRWGIDFFLKKKILKFVKVIFSIDSPKNVQECLKSGPLYIYIYIYIYVYIKIDSDWSGTHSKS